MTERDLDAAFEHLVGFVQAHRRELVAMAAGRFALGTFLYPHGPLYSKTFQELDGERAEEIADAIVYTAQMLSGREDERGEARA